MEYWAKTTSEGLPGISVYSHMLHVGHVAKSLAKQRSHQLKLFGLNVQEVAFLAALHDIGKISQGFQRKCQRWLEDNGLLEMDRREGWETCVSDHSKISQFAIQNYLKQQGMKKSSASYWAAAIGGHHGRLHRVGRQGLIADAGMNLDDWEELRQKEIKKLETDFQSVPPSKQIRRDSPELWWLAGLTSVADWIGSDERFFSTRQSRGKWRVDCAKGLGRNRFYTSAF